MEQGIDQGHLLQPGSLALADDLQERLQDDWAGGERDLDLGDNVENSGAEESLSLAGILRYLTGSTRSLAHPQNLLESERMTSLQSLQEYNFIADKMDIIFVGIR